MARDLARHGFVVLFGGATLLYLALVLALPELWLRLAWKEGPIEHAGHAVLFTAAVTWIVVGVRAPARGAKLLSSAVAVYLALTFMEEIDWGEAYGLELGHDWVERVTGGSSSFHNAQAPHGSILGWSVVWMAGPMVCYFAAPLVPWPRLRSLWERAAPARCLVIESVLFFTAALLTVAIDSIPLLAWRLGRVPRAPGGDPIGSPLGTYQALFYALWLMVAMRANRERAVKPHDATVLE